MIWSIRDQKCERYKTLFLKHGCTLKTSYKNYIEFIFRNGNESRHQINSNFIVNNEIGK